MLAYRTSEETASHLIRLRGGLLPGGSIVSACGERAFPCGVESYGKAILGVLSMVMSGRST